MIDGSNVIVQNAAEEHCIRRQWSRDIGRAKANAVQRDRADALALTLAPEILAWRAQGYSFRDIAEVLNECGRASARRPLGGGDAPAALAPSRNWRCNRCNLRDSRIIV
jgi:hypothetical protein